jgi:hypothetical protein
VTNEIKAVSAFEITVNILCSSYMTKESRAGCRLSELFIRL